MRCSPIAVCWHSQTRATRTPPALTASTIPAPPHSRQISSIATTSLAQKAQSAPGPVLSANVDFRALRQETPETHRDHPIRIQIASTSRAKIAATSLEHGQNLQIPQILQQSLLRVSMTHSRMLFGCAIFLASFLLFLVEPMAAKQLLPIFGGSAAVWITCLVFFQTALLVAYLYAHWLARRSHWSLQFALLLLATAAAIFWAKQTIDLSRASQH